MPASRARTAICSAPLEWPSSPGLPTRNLMRRPSLRETRSTSARTRSRPSPGCAAAPATPVGARYSPNTSRSAAPHSPVVTPALAHAIEAGMMLRPCWAAAFRAASADAAARDRLEPPRIGFDELLLHVARLDRGDRAAHGVDPRELGFRLALELRDFLGDRGRAVENVRIVEQVGLIGEYLLQAQRPLLVPRPRQAERLVPVRKLHRA